MTVLCYHSVESGWESPLAVDPDEFERHCSWLRRHRRIVGVDQLASVLAGTGRSPRGAVALSFDDGFASLYDNALPVLRRHSVPATVFVVGQTLVDDGGLDWIQPKPPSPQRALSREQIVEMRELGVMFGSHSYAHQKLELLAEDECVRDLRASREVLEELLGEPIRLLAYPYGRHAPHVRRAAQRAGFDFALSLPESRETPGQFAVPRIGVYRTNGTMALRAKTSRWYAAWRTGALYPMTRRLRPVADPAPKS